MKAKITQVRTGNVTLEYDWMGERVYREFMVTDDNRYVREYVNDEWKQVCDGLTSRGSTLMCNADNLIKVIRREWRVYSRDPDNRDFIHWEE